MSIRDRRGLKQAAAQALSSAPDHRKTVLFSVGLAAGASMLVSILNLILDSFIAQTGGLQGMGTRGLLTTVQTVLSMAISMLMPFWAYGLTAAMLRYARQAPVSRSTLLEGLRRFGPVLRLMLLRYLIYMLIAFVVIQLLSPVLAITPLAQPLVLFLEQHPDLLASATIDEATALAMVEACKPMLLVMGAVCFAVLIPVFYSFRMADLRIMDDPRCGAVAALLGSVRMLRRNRLALFALDASFWQYYLAQGLLALLVNGSLILELLEISLPISNDVTFLLCQAAGLLGQLVLFYFTRAQVEVTYAKAYEALLPQPQA